MADDILRLGQFESKAIIALGARAVGVYVQKMAIAGDSLLSTLFVESLGVGGSVLIEYFDYGVGYDVGEVVTLAAHAAAATPLVSDRISVSNFHDKPYVRATVTGASVTFGVYVTVRTAPSSQASLQAEAIALLEQMVPLTAGGVFSEIAVGLTAVEVKVGGSRLPNRKSVTVFALDSKLFWGYSNTVTPSNGTPIFKSQLFSWDADDTCQIWIVSIAAGKKARISESP